MKRTVMNKWQELLSAKIYKKTENLTMQFVFLHGYKKDIEQSWSGVCAYTK